MYKDSVLVQSTIPGNGQRLSMMWRWSSRRAWLQSPPPPSGEGLQLAPRGREKPRPVLHMVMGSKGLRIYPLAARICHTCRSAWLHVEDSMRPITCSNATERGKPSSEIYRTVLRAPPHPITAAPATIGAGGSQIPRSALFEGRNQ